MKITRHIDGDTFKVDGKSVRLLGINTPESVAVHSDRNTPEGAEASKEADVILPVGTNVRVEGENTGKFKRELRDIKIQTDKGEVDYAFVALNKGMSKYTVNYGIHPDPAQHKRFEEFFSDSAPYQYHDVKDPLTQEEYTHVAESIQTFDKAEEEYKNGNLPRKEYENAMYDAYGKENSDRVAAYRYMNHNWQRKFDMSHYDRSERLAYDWAHQSDENKAKYDKAVRNTYSGFRNPEKHHSFWAGLQQDFSTMFSTLNDIAVLGRSVDLVNARQFGNKEHEISDTVLLSGIPDSWKDKVLHEAANYGDDAALQYRDNLITELKNTENIKNMPVITQIAASIAATVLSPTSLIPGVGVGKGVILADRTISAVMKVGSLSLLKIPAKVALYGSAGAVEAGLGASLRYATEDTYTSMDFLNELKYGAVGGVAIPAVIKTVGATAARVKLHRSGMKKAFTAIQKETEHWVDIPYKKPEPNVRTVTNEPYLDEIDTSQYLANKGKIAQEKEIQRFEDEMVTYNEFGLKNPKKVEIEKTAEPKEEVPVSKEPVENPVENTVEEPTNAPDKISDEDLDLLSRDAEEAHWSEQDATLSVARPKVTEEKIPKSEGTPETTQVAPVKPTKPVDVRQVKVLTPEDLNYLDNKAEGIPQPEKSPREIAEIVDAQDKSREHLEYESVDRVISVINDFVPTARVRSKTSATVDALTAKLSKSFTQVLLESPSKVAKFLGETLLELPEGYGGKTITVQSAALQQHSLRTRYLSQTQPRYHKNMGLFASEEGKWATAKFVAQHSDGQHNTLVDQFNRQIMTLIEQRRQGHNITIKSKAVLDTVNNLEVSMKHMYEDLVDAGVTGFRQGRRIKHYFPQLWDKGAIRGAITKYGHNEVQKVLAQGYVSSKHNTIKSMNEALFVAKRFLKKMGRDDFNPDNALPASMDARAKTRLDIDTTISRGDLSIMDLLQNDFTTVTAKYTNRVAGQVALANKGLKSTLDIDMLRNLMKSQGGDLQQFDDAINLVMGRPTRDGMDESLREIQEAISLAKLGGLGMAQAAEIGGVMNRSLQYLVSDPRVFAKIWAMAGESTKNLGLMRETQALSGISNEVHLLDKQAANLDRYDLEAINKARNVSQWIAGKLTFGKFKQPAGYILSQMSGFNMIRRFERRLANASFMIDTAKTFKNGTGKMSARRLRDIGLDPNSKELKHIFNNIVEYDEHGIVKKLNIDKWDKKVRENYHLAMYKDDAQMVQQPLGGELPAWFNKPAMSLLTQFKSAAILANKKQLVRNMQFADQEAVTGAMLNALFATLSRTAKFASLGAAAYAVTGDKSNLVNPLELDYLQPEKYVGQLGYFPDMGHIIYDSYKAYDENRLTLDMAGAKTATAGIAGEIPTMDWMKDYYDVATADSLAKKADAVKGVAILGNMHFADVLYKALEKVFNQ